MADGQNSDKYKAAFPYIGDKVAFKVVKDVVKDGKVLIEKDTIVYAKIGEVSPRAMGGAPAEMTIEGFEMYDKNWFYFVPTPFSPDRVRSRKPRPFPNRLLQ